MISRMFANASTIILMLVKLLKSSLLRCFFADTPLKKVGREFVAEMPSALLATKPKPKEEDERFPINVAAERYGRSVVMKAILRRIVSLIADTLRWSTRIEYTISTTPTTT